MSQTQKPKINPRRIGLNMVIVIAILLVSFGLMGILYGGCQRVTNGIDSFVQGKATGTIGGSGTVALGVVPSASKATDVSESSVVTIVSADPTVATLGSSAATTTRALTVTSENMADSTLPISTVSFLDVGQGDSTIYVFPDGKCMLIDTGEYSAIPELKAALKAAGINRIDVFVITHQHTDHMGSAATIIRDFDIGTVYMPNTPPALIPDTVAMKELNNEMVAKNIVSVCPEQGDVLLSGDGYSVKVLSASDDVYTDINDYSIVTQITIGATVIVAEGDAGEPTETNMYNEGVVPACNILRIAHHGSSGSSSFDWLSMCHATDGIISVGENNEYGLPTSDILARLTLYNIKVYRTDLNGTITALISQAAYTIETGK